MRNRFFPINIPKSRNFRVLHVGGFEVTKWSWRTTVVRSGSREWRQGWGCPNDNGQWLVGWHGREEDGGRGRWWWGSEGSNDGGCGLGRTSTMETTTRLERAWWPCDHDKWCWSEHCFLWCNAQTQLLVSTQNKDPPMLSSFSINPTIKHYKKLFNLWRFLRDIFRKRHECALQPKTLRRFL
jgi:hypothetical protein